MTDHEPPPPEPGPKATPQRSGPGEKRPRTVYVLHRRYRLLGRLAAVIGAAVGIGLVAYSLGPVIAAGERVPLASYVVAVLIVAALAFFSWAAVRWRWRSLKASLDDY